MVRQFEDRVAAITGAGSGIGRALAVELAARGTHLGLSDIDQARLNDTVELLDRRPVRVTAQVLDVADREAMFAWADTVASDHGGVNLIVNNAGVAVVAPVESLDYDDFQWLMNINFWGVVHGTQAFLPHLKRSGEGHVVNISSVFGLTAVPSQAAYNAAKFAVRGFTDALRIELEMDPCGVSATTVHPGGVRTNIVRDAKVSSELAEDHGQTIADFDRLARTSPEQAAQRILAAVEKNRRRALIGPDAVVFDLVSRLPAAVPQRLFRLAANRRRQQSGREEH